MNMLSVSGLVVFIASIITAIFVYSRNPKNQINITWSLFCLFVAMWSFGLFMGFDNPDKPAALFWGRFLNLSAVFIPLVFLHFVYAFIGLTKKKRSILISVYIITLFYFFLSLALPHLFVKDVLPKGPFAFYPEAGTIYYFFPVLYSAIVLYGIFELFKAYKAASGQKRNQINYLFWGMAIGFSGGATTFPYVFNINIYPFGVWAVVFYVVLVAIGITKARLMNISVIISRLTAALITLSFYGLIYLFLAFLYRVYISTYLGWLFVAISSLYSILVGITYPFVRLKIQTTADVLFLRGKYDYYKELSHASTEAAKKLSLPAILKVLYTTFHEVIEINDPLIFLAENINSLHTNTTHYIPYNKETFLPQPKGKEVDVHDPIVKKLTEERKPFLNGNDRLIVPCLFEGRLIGFFALGEKLSEDPYTDRDIHLLHVLANQTAISIRNVSAIQELKKAHTALKKAQAKNEAVLSSIGEAMIVTDSSGKCIMLNKPAEQLFGISEDKDMGKSVFPLVHLEDKNGYPVKNDRTPLMTALKKHKTINSVLYLGINKRKIPLDITASPVLSRGKTIGCITLFKDITKEQQIDSAKTEFVSLASHQLRTPLTAMKWSLSEIMRVSKPDKKLREYIKDAIISNERMNRLVNELLNVSRLETGAISVSPKKINVISLIDQVIKEATPQLKQKKQELKFTFSKGPVFAEADPQLLHQVLANILSNAIKYSDDNKQIKIKLSNSLKKATITVADQGIGIPDGQKHRIFQKFFRTIEAAKRSTTGSGLGMYIVKKITEECGWGISFETKEGKGTTVKLVLPKKAVIKKKGFSELIQHRLS